jgi:hypothetical protein
MASTIRKFCVLLLMVALQFLPLATTVYARKKVDNSAAITEEAGKSYAMPYALVVLGVALGVMMVARPSTRDDGPKRRKIDEEEED